MTSFSAIELAHYEEMEARRRKRAEEFPKLLAFIRSSTPDELAQILARNRVERGLRWLARNAPPGWWRNCLDPGRGSRINMTYTEESILARVFEYDPRFADEFGYVQDWKVLRHFFGPRWGPMGLHLGFVSGFLSTTGPFPKRFPEVTITDAMLTKAWDEFVMNPPGDWLLPYRHTPSRWMLDLESKLQARQRRPNLLDRVFGRKLRLTFS